MLQEELGLALALCWRSAGKWRSIVGMGSAGVLAGAALWLFVLYGEATGSAGRSVPSGERGVLRVSRVPNAEQDYFYDVLAKGEMGLSVFPTGMFLGR